MLLIFSKSKAMKLFPNAEVCRVIFRMDAAGHGEFVTISPVEGCRNCKKDRLDEVRGV